MPHVYDTTLHPPHVDTTQLQLHLSLTTIYYHTHYRNPGLTVVGVDPQGCAQTTTPTDAPIRAPSCASTPNQTITWDDALTSMHNPSRETFLNTSQPLTHASWQRYPPIPTRHGFHLHVQRTNSRLVTWQATLDIGRACHTRLSTHGTTSTVFFARTLFQNGVVLCDEQPIDILVDPNLHHVSTLTYTRLVDQLLRTVHYYGAPQWRHPNGDPCTHPHVPCHVAFQVALRLAQSSDGIPRLPVFTTDQIAAYHDTINDDNMWLLNFTTPPRTHITHGDCNAHPHGQNAYSFAFQVAECTHANHTCTHNERHVVYTPVQPVDLTFDWDSCPTYAQLSRDDTTQDVHMDHRLRLYHSPNDMVPFPPAGTTAHTFAAGDTIYVDLRVHSQDIHSPLDVRYDTLILCTAATGHDTCNATSYDQRFTLLQDGTPQYTSSLGSSSCWWNMPPCSGTCPTSHVHRDNHTAFTPRPGHGYDIFAFRADPLLAAPDDAIWHLHVTASIDTCDTSRRLRDTRPMTLDTSLGFLILAPPPTTTHTTPQDSPPWTWIAVGISLTLVTIVAVATSYICATEKHTYIRTSPRDDSNGPTHHRLRPRRLHPWHHAVPTPTSTGTPSRLRLHHATHTSPMPHVPARLLR